MSPVPDHTRVRETVDDTVGPVTIAASEPKTRLFAQLLGILPVIVAIGAAIATTELRTAVLQALPLVLKYVALLVVLPLLATFGLRRFGCRVSYPHALAFVSAVAFIAFAGAHQVVAVILFAGLAATAGGALLGSRASEASSAEVTTALLAGSALSVGAMAWLLPLPVHSRLAYTAIGALALYAGRGASATMMARLATDARRMTAMHPAMSTLCVAVAGLCVVFAWLPSLGYDDNSGHLLMAYQLEASGYYHMDISTHLGALTPWLNNVLHSYLTLVAGGDARPLVGVIWLLFGCTGSYRLARALGAGEQASLAAATLYASYPLTAYFTTTLQVDGASAATLLHLLAATVDRSRQPVSPGIAGALMGLLAGLKMTNLVFVALIVPVLMWKWTREGRLRCIVTAALAAAFVSASSYVYAWIVTGNPVFPFYNALFKSPYMSAENFVDPRWQSGFDLGTLWGITFDTSRFMEAYPGAAGLSLVAFSGALLLAIVGRGRPAVLVAGAIAVGLLFFHQVQYLRYLFPVIAVLGTVAVVTLFAFLGRRSAIASVVIVVVAQCALMRTTSWMFNDGAVDRLVASGPAARNDLERQYAPERVLLQRLVERDRPFCALSASRDAPYIALGGGSVASTAWYDFRMSRAGGWADQDASGARWKQVLSSTGVTHVLLRSSAVNAAMHVALAEAGFELVDAEGDAQAWARLTANASACQGRLFTPRDEALRLRGG